MTRILVENLNGLDLGGITTHIFNYISVLQRSSDYKIDIVVTVQENNDVIDKFKSLGCGIIHLPHRQKQLFRYIMNYKALRLKESPTPLIIMEKNKNISYERFTIYDRAEASRKL